MGECRSNRAPWRIQVLTKHLAESVPAASSVQASECLAYEPPEANSGIKESNPTTALILILFLS